MSPDSWTGRKSERPSEGKHLVEATSPSSNTNSQTGKSRLDSCFWGRIMEQYALTTITLSQSIIWLTQDLHHHSPTPAEQMKCPTPSVWTCETGHLGLPQSAWRRGCVLGWGCDLPLISQNQGQTSLPLSVLPEWNSSGTETSVSNDKQTNSWMPARVVHYNNHVACRRTHNLQLFTAVWVLSLVAFTC